MRSSISAIAGPLAVGVMLGLTAPALAEGDSATMDENRQAADALEQTGEVQDQREEARDAEETVREAVQVVGQMKADENMSRLLANAAGIYIVPDFGRAALGVGGSGGSGVMLSRNGGQWSDPAFYDFGGISLGAQAGVTAGSIAFILMSEEAVDAFRDENQFSLNADAGLTIVDYSAAAAATTQDGDIVLWSDMEGAYAGATISVTDVNWDEEENHGYYGKRVTPEGLISGSVAVDKGRTLKSALSG